MKKISAMSKQAIQQEVTSLAYCCRIKFRDGQEIGLTSVDGDLVIDGHSYKASRGFVPSSISTSHELSVDNMEIISLINTELITDEDIFSGKMDDAEVEFFMIDHFNLSAGKINLQSGRIGEIKLLDSKFIAELRGQTQVLAQNIGELYSPLCRAIFCDRRCGLKPEDYEHVVEITERISQSKFRVGMPGNIHDNDLSYGLFTLAKDNTSYEIKENFGDTVELMLPLAKDVSVGEKCRLRLGCDKKFETCIGKFNNAVNFRGEPHVPCNGVNLLC